jgi:hypothetical protein
MCYVPRPSEALQAELGLQSNTRGQEGCQLKDKFIPESPAKLYWVRLQPTTHNMPSTCSVPKSEGRSRGGQHCSDFHAGVPGKFVWSKRHFQRGSHEHQGSLRLIESSAPTRTKFPGANVRWQLT